MTLQQAAKSKKPVFLRLKNGWRIRVMGVKLNTADGYVSFVVLDTALFGSSTGPMIILPVCDVLSVAANAGEQRW